MLFTETGHFGQDVTSESLFSILTAAKGIGLSASHYTQLRQVRGALPEKQTYPYAYLQVHYML